MSVTIEDIRKALAESPDLLKSLEEVVGEQTRAANLEQELDILKTQFSEETETLTKALVDQEARADEAEANLAKAFEAVAEFGHRQEALAKCLTEAVGPSIVAMRDQIKATQDLVKALADRPAPSKAVAIEIAEESNDEDEAAGEDFDYASVLRKALSVDRANKDKNTTLWKSFKALEGYPKQFREKAIKEELV